MIKEKLVKEKPIHMFKGVDFEGDYTIHSDGYVISNHARMKGKNVDGNIMKTSVNNRGYETLTLNKNGVRVASRVHRLVALHFCKNDDPIDKTHVDHVDGNKLNNHYTNLEWVTPHENNLRARKMGLMYMVVTEDLCHKICKMIWDKGMTDTEISKELGIEIHIINNISRGKNHRHISEKYSNGNWCPNSNALSEEMLHRICDMVWNKNIRDSTISKKLGINVQTINSISGGISNRYISDQYSRGQWNPNTNKITEEMINKICELRWINHKNIKGISILTGISPRSIRRITNCEKHMDISLPYRIKAYDKLSVNDRRFIKDMKAHYNNYEGSLTSKIEEAKRVFKEYDNQIITLSMRRLSGLDDE